MKEEVFLGATWRTDEVFGVLDKMNAIEGANRLLSGAACPKMRFTPAGDLPGRVLLQSREVLEGRRPRLD